jgi:hypothetical protein
MRLDLDISYPHCPFTAEPSYVGVEVADGVALSVRQQLGFEDGSRLAVDLEVLIHRIYARLCHHCERLELSPADLQCFDPLMLSRRFECIAAAAAVSQDHLTIIDRRIRAVDELLTRLARDFGVTKRFIEVRLLRYGFLGQAKTVA